MGLEEVKQKIRAEMDFHKPGSSARYSLTEAIEMLEGLEEVDEPPVDVDDGFAILPMPRYEALREAEEHLQETRFGPADDEHDDKQATIDALKRENARLKAVMSSWEVFARIKGDEIARLKGDAKVRAEAAAPPRADDEVLLMHIQDHQAEIEGIKARLDEQSDRLHGFIARMNKIEANHRVDPILRDEARERDEATRDRLLQEIKRVTGRVESTKP